MKKLHSFLKKVISSLENTPLTLSSWLFTFTALIGVRFGIELSLEGFMPKSFSFLFFQFSHLFLFFLLSYLLLLPIVQLIGKVTFQNAAKMLLFGFSIIWVPPIIDKLIFSNGLYWSFYIFDKLANMPTRFLTFFGKDPHIGITYGVRIEVALVLILLFVYGFIKTRAFRRTLLLTLLAYAVLFFLGTLPSWLGYIFLLGEYPITAVTNIQLAELFLSPESILGKQPAELQTVLSHKMSLLLFPSLLFITSLFWYKNNKMECLSLLQNIRIPQIVYHAGLAILGMLLASIYSSVFFTPTLFSFAALLNLLIGITAAWLFTVIQNDIFDQKIDLITNTHRPLATGSINQERYQLYAFILLLVSLWSVSLVSFQSVLFILFYVALATLYSAPPFRLKRFFGIATAIASLAAMNIFFLGYTLGHKQNMLADIPLSLVFYLFFIYLFALPLKDFKDTAGDKADGVITLPVLVGEQKAKTIMSTVCFILILSSIFVIHAPELLLWALLFGSIGFWIVQKSNRDGYIRYAHLPAWFIILVTLYGLGITFFLFPF